MDDCTAAVEGNICKLGDDVMTSILSRLPPKRLGICKCVSRSWRRLVSILIHSPTRPRLMTGFFLGFVDRAKGRENVVHFNRRNSEFKIDLDFLPCHPDARIVNCRDGFLLCSSQNIRDQDKYFVCNPVTRQWASLPHPPDRGSDGGLDVNAALVLDESCDFYYSHYKVVRFVNVYGKNPRTELDVKMDSSKDEDEDSSPYLYVDVYSSHSGKWTESEAFLKGISCAMLEGHIVFFGGALFVLAAPCHVLMYDVKEDSSKMLNLPTNDFGFSVHRYCLGESKGCLNFAYRNGPEVQVWTMESGNIGEWVLKHRINEHMLDVLAFHPDLDVIFARMDFYVSYYYLESKDSETIMCLPPFPLSMLSLQVYPFSECLCPVADAQRMT